MTTDHCGAMQVKAWELLPGDRILGMSCEVVDGPRYSQGDIGGDRERQRYTYTLSNGDEITYVADGPGPRVLRSEVGEYKAQSARDAMASNYGGRSYWDYLESHAHEMHDYFVARGDEETAARMLTRSLGESLVGNEGE